MEAAGNDGFENVDVLADIGLINERISSLPL